MKIVVLGVPVEIDFWFTAVVSLMLVIDRTGIMLYSLAAIAVHEVGHIIVMIACGEKLQSVRFCAFGILIGGGSEVSDVKRIAVAAAGPLANLLPLIFITHPYMRLTMAVTGIFNLIPIVGTDGGDIVKILLCMTLGEKGETASRIVSAVVSIAAIIAGTMLLIKCGNLSVFLAALYFAAVTVASLIKK